MLPSLEVYLHQSEFLINDKVYKEWFSLLVNFPRGIPNFSFGELAKSFFFIRDKWFLYTSTKILIVKYFATCQIKY